MTLYRFTLSWSRSWRMQAIWR